jgi:PAS domain S-box-containing protein
MAAAEALKLSEERYRAFVKQSSEAICLFELEHAPLDTSLPPEEQIDQLYAQAVIGECNQNFAASHGYERPEEMFGFRIGQIFPRLAPENVNYLRQFIENGHQLADVETKELARDGTVKYFLNSLIGQVEDGRLLRVWGAKQDITRLKKAEEEIHKLNEELERRVRERTADLEAFSYSVSHDLRAPLRAIDGYTRMLAEDYGKLFDEEGQRICGVISDSARDMGKLIEDLLSFSRIGRAELRRIEVDMTVLAESVYREATAPAERVRIDFHLAPLPPAQGDPVLLRQVWMNLLGNAVKFSRRQERAVIEVGVASAGTDRERGIRAAASGSPPVAVGGASGQATRTTREEPVYFVRDNGAGFDMSYASKLFGVFQRLHSAREFEGTGVGLAIVQRIIHRHGGRIWAEGAVGKGATFYFTLPG